jgi:RHS repeat-associated protein
METTDTNSVQAVYNYGNDLISMSVVSSPESEVYYHYDGLGSAVALSNSSGQIVEKYRYNAFGQSTILSPSDEPRETSDVGNPYGFTGEQQFNEADNLVFLRARYYNPRIGRFISRDPIGYKGGLNLYTYCRNNPINYTDPKGRCSARDKCIEDAYQTFSLCMAIGEAIIKVAEAGFQDCLSDCDKRMPPIMKEACKGGCVAVWGPILSAAYTAALSWEAGCEIGIAADLMDCSLIPCPCP